VYVHVVLSVGLIGEPRQHNDRGLPPKNRVGKSSVHRRTGAAIGMKANDPLAATCVTKFADLFTPSDRRR
jgi:hypothetical protein